MFNLRLPLFSLLLGTAAVAQTASSAPMASPSLPAGRMHSVLFSALDSDHNGVLSAAEIAAAPTVLRALDLDGDGDLSADELRRFELNRPAVAGAAATARATRNGHGSIRFILAFALDANGDGIIQAMEIANATTSLNTLDANGDGQLAASELRSAATFAHHEE